jgi:DNA-binding MarR family transcriptional regulator
LGLLLMSVSALGVARFWENDECPLTGELLAYTSRRDGREIEVMTKPATGIERIATSCVAGRLRLLNRVVTNLYDDALRPVGVRLSQGSVLAVAARLGVARPAQVCEFLELDASTLSRTVDRMVGNGWLEVVPDADGRSQPFRLTAEGRRLLERALPAWERAQAEAGKLLGDDGLRLLDAAIGRVKSAHAGA